MKVSVPIKRVIDYNVKVRVKADGSGMDLASVKMSMHPFDEIAVEEAVRLKEAGTASKVMVVSSADRAVLVETDAELEPLAVAKLLAAVAATETTGPTKFALREWLVQRRKDRSQPLPTPEKIRQQLGWRLPPRPAGAAK